jgi:hypothetical protein
MMILLVPDLESAKAATGIPQLSELLPAHPAANYANSSPVIEAHAVLGHV